MESAKQELQSSEQCKNTWKNHSEFFTYLVNPDFLHTTFPIKLLVDMPNDFISLLAQMIYNGFITTQNISNPKLFKALYRLNSRGERWFLKYDHSFHVKKVRVII